MSGPHVGTAEHLRWLDGIAKAVLLPDLPDALSTPVRVRAGDATARIHG